MIQEHQINQHTKPRPSLYSAVSLARILVATDFSKRRIVRSNTLLLSREPTIRASSLRTSFPWT